MGRDFWQAWLAALNRYRQALTVSLAAAWRAVSAWLAQTWADRRSGERPGTWAGAAQGLAEAGRGVWERLVEAWSVGREQVARAWFGLSPARRANTVAGSAAVVAFLLLSLTNAPGQPAPKPSGVGGRPEFIAYFENFSTAAAPASFPGLHAHYALINVLMPLWFSVDASGTVVNSQVDTAVDDYASSHGIRVEPMFTNLGYYMLTSPQARANAATNITNTVVHLGFNGADIDFELMPPAVRGDYSLFIRMLGAKMHAAGKALSVTVFPKPGVSYSVTGSEDYAALTANSDYLVLMAYDNHSDSSGPGPVAPLPWVVDGIRYALRVVPPSKLVLAIGQYGYDWDTSTGATNYLSAVAADQLAKTQGVPILWDAGQGEAHFSFGSHVIWFQDTRSLALELALVKKYHLRGFALWRLGFETPTFWTQVAKLGR